MGIGLLAGYVVGQSIGSNADNKRTIGYIGAGAGAASGALYSLYMEETVNEAQSLNIQSENEALKLKVAEFEKQMALKLISKGTGASDKTPVQLKEYLGLGKWELYDLEQWVQSPEDENIYYKQTQQLKLIPKEEQ